MKNFDNRRQFNVTHCILTLVFLHLVLGLKSKDIMLNLGCVKILIFVTEILRYNVKSWLCEDLDFCY